MTRKLPGIQTFDDLKARCYVDEATGHWHWRGAFTVQQGGYRIATTWLSALQRTATLPKAIGVLMGKPIPEGRLWYRTCTQFDCANPAHHRLGTRSEMCKKARPKNTLLHNARISAARRRFEGKQPVRLGVGSIFNLGG
jgi:hypothetical protein